MCFLSEQFSFFCVFFFLLGGRSRFCIVEVERHSLCPVFTSLEFKRPAGRWRLPFTSRHLHFPLHTVHSQLLIRLCTSHTLSLSHTVSINKLSFLIPSTQTQTIMYKPLTIIHRRRCAHGINTACGLIFFFSPPVFIFLTVRYYKSSARHSFLHM